MSEQLSPDEIDEIERYIPPANPDALHQPLRQVIASHRALQRERDQLKADLEFNTQAAVNFVDLSAELRNERDALKRRVEELKQVLQRKNSYISDIEWNKPF